LSHSVQLPAQTLRHLPRLSASRHLPALHSFPTRRSSDLSHGLPDFPDPTISGGGIQLSMRKGSGLNPHSPVFQARALAHRELDRSEEHTSELQSRSDLVCRLLLEKKKATPLTVLVAAVFS